MSPGDVWGISGSPGPTMWCKRGVVAGRSLVQPLPNQPPPRVYSNPSVVVLPPPGTAPLGILLADAPRFVALQAALGGPLTFPGGPERRVPRLLDPKGGSGAVFLGAHRILTFELKSTLSLSSKRAVVFLGVWSDASDQGRLVIFLEIPRYSRLEGAPIS